MLLALKVVFCLPSVMMCPRGRLEGANLYATLGAGGYRARAGDHGFALLASGLAAGSGARADDAGPLWDLP